MMKYIINKNKEVIIFQPSIEHSAMAKAFNGAISAGFLAISGDTVHIPETKSLSLDLGPNQKVDSLLIKKHLML